MARQPRLEVPGFLYHVTNRGLERRDIVRDDEDRWTWLRLLDRVATRCRWRVFAYVLLDNHFHLYFQLTEKNLSSGMHDLESGYASLFNKNHQRNGPLFQGRFHSVIVENESHSLELSRYLHLNPVRAGIIPNPLGYLWSSYRFYLNPNGAPAWLDWRSVLGGISVQEATSRIAYKRFVDAGVQSPYPNPWDGLIGDWILGSDAFADRCRALLQQEESRCVEMTLDDLIRLAANRFGVSITDVEQRGRHGNRAREAAVMLSREHMSESLEALAIRFGGVSRSTISETVRRARERMDRDTAFREAIEDIRHNL